MYLLFYLFLLRLNRWVQRYGPVLIEIYSLLRAQIYLLLIVDQSYQVCLTTYNDLQ